MSTISAGPSSHGHDDGHADGHGHDHPPFLAHHFETPQQQFDSAKLGMWLFLATEVLFFGGLFVAYAVLRVRFPEVFSYASLYLDTILGGINTTVLILSSLTMALAVRYAQTGRKSAMLLCLWLTLAGAAGFMVIKYFEYQHKLEVNLKWGTAFYVPPDSADGREEMKALATPLPPPPPLVVTDPTATALPVLAEMPPVDQAAIRPAAQAPTGLASPRRMAEAEGIRTVATEPDKAAAFHLEDPRLPPNTHLFFAIYYAMTGLHGVHVVIGGFMLVWLIWRGMRGDFGPQYYTPVDVGGLYWHVVDLVWIFLFPLFYLIH
ncbi:MAG: cytochrome c oxidase subunit 3 family protein [Phycisphaeraceae bacterium]|nr:cytochrome c oxidase subunit 3 family protein [Phycisphaeraceae bacterium]